MLLEQITAMRKLLIGAIVFSVTIICFVNKMIIELILHKIYEVMLIEGIVPEFKQKTV